MSYVNVKILPIPHNIEFKRIGRLLFDINYVEYTKFNTNLWRNSKEQYHRENGPAILWVDGEQRWCRYGDIHREDGPAETWIDREQYWLNDIYYSEEDFNEEIWRRHELRKCKNLTNTL